MLFQCESAPVEELARKSWFCRNAAQMICAADLYEQIIWADERTGLFIPAGFL
jgi:hypothetical protein